jgi:hypothetical protein
MKRRPTRIARRAVAIGSLLFVMSACGGGTGTADPVAAPAPTNDRPAAVDGTELAGVEFDVRRDPG